MAPCGNLPHRHPKGPLWGVEGRELEGFSCTKTPQTHGFINTPTRMCTHVHSDFSRCLLALHSNPAQGHAPRDHFCAHTDMVIMHTSIHTSQTHGLVCCPSHPGCTHIYILTTASPNLNCPRVPPYEPATMHTWTCTYSQHVHTTIHRCPPHPQTCLTPVVRPLCCPPLLSGRHLPHRSCWCRHGQPGSRWRSI